MPKSTTKKSPNATIAQQRRSKTPERIYKVKPKKQVVKPRPKIKRRHHKHKQLLSMSLPRVATIVIIVFVTTLASGVVFVRAYQAYNALRSANESASDALYSKEMVEKMRLIGDGTNYPNEIINYQSAPQDLQNFLVQDYKKLKTGCIINGQFAGTLQYTVVNVVYDSFARIEKNCNGADTLLLSKISGVWTVIYAGNDLPPCDAVNAFDIPRGLSSQCRDGLVTYTNPNP